MRPLINSRYLREKSAFGPFTFHEFSALTIVSLITWFCVYVFRNVFDYSTIWASFIPCCIIFICFLAKLWLNTRKRNPTWFASVLSFYFYQPKHDRLYKTFRNYAFLKEEKSA